MKIIFASLLIIFLAFSGYHLSFKNFKPPLFMRVFYLSGTEFLFLGFLLGPRLLNIIDNETVKALEPFTTFLLGWIGFLFGLQLEIRKIKRYPFEFLIGSILEGFIAFIIVFAGSYLILTNIDFLAGKLSLPAILVLSAVASCTAPTGLALSTTRSIRKHDNTVKLLQYISSIDGLIAILVFGLAFFPRTPVFFEAGLFHHIGMNALLYMGACLGCIILFAILLSIRREGPELILLAIGMVVFTGGTAMILNFSPLIINFLVGFSLVNLTKNENRLFAVFIGIEKPVYLILLIFLGVSWHFETIWILFPAAAYCMLRFFGKILGGYVVTRIGSEMKKYPSLLGIGLLCPGGLPLAILLDFQKGFSGPNISLVTCMVLISVIYNDILSPNLLERLLGKDK
ncbi:hypothetical protein [Desulfosarcina sp. BuS5]|uniref:hypothetical protein n=1 Tax=Desulfosarcina sp. BuS5 TaxID=933262 RepID=UPI0012FB5EEA|nr:hypothetical protein [Desulfosarcina sp. BuS5]